MPRSAGGAPTLPENLRLPDPKKEVPAPEVAEEALQTRFRRTLRGGFGGFGFSGG